VLVIGVTDVAFGMGSMECRPLHLSMSVLDLLLVEQ
jgi:hypothetical protein